MRLTKRAMLLSMAAALVLAVAGRAGAVPPTAEAAKTPGVDAKKPAVEAAKPAVQSAKPTIEPAKPTSESAKPSVEPEAMSALQAMGTYLRTLKSFEVEAKTTDEDVLDDGQKVQNGGMVTIVAELPGRLRAEVESDLRSRLYLYDGKTFTLYAKRINYYATVPAPPTVRKLADVLDEKYGFGVPLEDLFLWGDPEWSVDPMTSAIDVGGSVVEGVTCEQYAFREADIDWQIWIQKGAHPLPRKLVITSRTDEARPQYTAVYTWNLAPSYNEDTFVFHAPDGAAKVVLADALGAAK